MTQRIDNSWVNWSIPINLGKEVNSSGFDAYFSVGNEQTAYFSSNRSGGLSKLYSVKYDGEISNLNPNLTAKKATNQSQCGDPCEEITKLRELLEKQRAEYAKHEFNAEGKVAIPKPVYIFFELSSTNIAKDFEQDLEFVANFLKANPSFAITLTGHADKRGNRKINEQISAKRAAACKDFIVKKGVDARRITMSSYGADREINEKIFIDEAQNRRVEIHFNRLDVN